MENTDNKLNIGAVEVLLLELYLYLRSPLATNVQGRLIVKPRCTRNVHLSHQHGRHEGSANTKAHSRLTGLRKRSPVMERRGDLRVGYSRGEYERERRPGGAEQGIGHHHHHHPFQVAEVKRDKRYSRPAEAGKRGSAL